MQHHVTQDTPAINESAAASSYGRIAWAYELGAFLGSGGQIQASKRHHLRFLKDNSRILYPGPGCGREVVSAVQAGHSPTIVELDPVMFRKAQQYYEKKGVLPQIECELANILDHDRPGEYDAVVASYILDVFSPSTMKTVYAHLVRQLKPGGFLFFSGYAPLNGSILHQFLQRINHDYANYFCKVMVNNASHKIYDYSSYFEEFNLVFIYQKDFPHFGTFGPCFHRMWVAQKI